MNRRKFLTILGSAGVVSALSTAEAKAGATHTFPYYENSYGVLHDTTRCIGCRQCEKACNKVNSLPKPKKAFDDLSVFADKRRPSAYEWTVVNKYEVHGKQVFRKLQCFHCNDPACASACFAKCFVKQPDGSVSYDGSQCVGCRYCMVACPFYMPGFQYDLAWDPLVQKCTFCEPRLKEGKLPGCVEACPMDALTFGRRKDLLKIARARMAHKPGKYVDYVYGEYDAGGTAWMILAPSTGTAPAGAGPEHDMHAMGLDMHLGNKPMGEYTYGALGAVPMIVAFWPVLFGGAYAMSKRRDAIQEDEIEAAVKAAKDDVDAAVRDAVQKIAQVEGPAAADTARQALSDALKEREDKASCTCCCGHGEGK